MALYPSSFSDCVYIYPAKIGPYVCSCGKVADYALYRFRQAPNDISEFLEAETFFCGGCAFKYYIDSPPNVQFCQDRESLVTWLEMVNSMGRKV